MWSVSWFAFHPMEGGVKRGLGNFRCIWNQVENTFEISWKQSSWKLSNFHDTYSGCDHHIFCCICFEQDEIAAFMSSEGNDTIRLLDYPLEHLLFPFNLVHSSHKERENLSNYTISLLLWQIMLFIFDNSIMMYSSNLWQCNKLQESVMVLFGSTHYLPTALKHYVLKMRTPYIMFLRM